MRVRDKDGQIHEVKAEEAQRLIEAGEAEPVAEPPVARAENTRPERVKRAERRGTHA
jgi:hypothetical protein